MVGAISVLNRRASQPSNEELFALKLAAALRIESNAYTVKEAFENAKHKETKAEVERLATRLLETAALKKTKEEAAAAAAACPR